MKATSCVIAATILYIQDILSLSDISVWKIFFVPITIETIYCKQTKCWPEGDVESMELCFFAQFLLLHEVLFRYLT